MLMVESEPRLIGRKDWLLIGVLLALVLPLRLWLLSNTEVTARDSIGYIRYALQFEQKPWEQVLLDNHQHPGYPVLVWLMSVPVRTSAGETTPENMELSAQLVNLIGSLLLILPSYFLGRQFFGRTVSFWGTLLYQYLPISAQHLSDGISEPVFLLLLVTGLWQGVCAIRQRQPWHAALCGLCTGLAYLTRPEGALLLPAFGLALVAVQFRAEWCSTWRRFAAIGSMNVLGAVLIGSIYVYATGTLTNKPGPGRMLLLRSVAQTTEDVKPSARAIGQRHLFAAAIPKTEDKTQRLFRSVWALISEVNQGYHYVAGIPCLLGLLWSFRFLRHNPGFWLVTIFVLLHSFVLVALAMSVSYVSDRHVMILVLLGCFLVAFGLCELPRRIFVWCKVAPSADTSISLSSGWFHSTCFWSAILFIAMFGVCMPKATQRLHGNRVGNHVAGAWLAEKLKAGDHVEDDHAWSHFFSGWFFKEGETPPKLAADYVPTTYVVITPPREINFGMPETISFVSRQMIIERLTKTAKVEYVWPEHAELSKARVVIYSQPRDWEKNRWTKSAN